MDLVWKLSWLFYPVFISFLSAFISDKILNKPSGKKADVFDYAFFLTINFACTLPMIYLIFHFITKPYYIYGIFGGIIAFLIYIEKVKIDASKNRSLVKS